MHSNPWRIALHGGAGVNPDADYTPVEEHMRSVIEEAGAILDRGGAALDAVEFAVRRLEESGLYVAGKGSAPNSDGIVELDASIMDGAARKAGAVCAAPNLASPIAAARAVLEHSPHVLLAGEGAVRFAMDHGIEQVANPDDYYTLAHGADEPVKGASNGLSHGTVGAVALDNKGRLAAATSTGGLFGKRAGRVGDTPLPGIGTWADETLAISCTGIGEAFIMAGGALGIAHRMAYAGLPLGEAGAAMLADVARHDGDGGYIAVTASGQLSLCFNSPGLKFAMMAAKCPAFAGTSAKQISAGMRMMTASEARFALD